MLLMIKAWEIQNNASPNSLSCRSVHVLVGVHGILFRVELNPVDSDQNWYSLAKVKKKSEQLKFEVYIAL